MVSPAQTAVRESRSRGLIRRGQLRHPIPSGQLRHLIPSGQLRHPIRRNQFRRHAKTAVPTVPNPVDQALVIEMDGHYVLSLMKERRNVQCIVIIMFRV